ncbi:hypothetical protein [Moorena sp. SIO3H5]|nr:hypothetical protein [Moorena sp. SIO3H5]
MQRGLGGSPHERLHQDGNKNYQNYYTDCYTQYRVLCLVLLFC